MPQTPSLFKSDDDEVSASKSPCNLPITDRVCFLEADTIIAKTITFKDGRWTKSKAEQRTYWLPKTVKVRSLDDLSSRLQKVADVGRHILVHGMPNVEDGTPQRRLGINFHDVRRPWLLIDLDALDLNEPDPEVAAEAARALLPPEFREARCFWSATAGHMIPEADGRCRPRLRLGFWTDRPISIGESLAWLAGCEAQPDLSIYRTVQPIYVGVIVEGADDPVPQRWGFLDGCAAVAVPNGLAGRTRASTEREMTAPDGVEENDPAEIRVLVDLMLSRSDKRISERGRRLTWMDVGQDAGDRAVSLDMARDLVCAWVWADADSRSTLQDALREAGCEDAEALARRVVEHGEELQDTWTAGEPLDEDELERMLGDAYSGRDTEFGSLYGKPAKVSQGTDGSAFGIVTDQGSYGTDTPPYELVTARREKAVSSFYLADLASRPAMPVRWLVKGVLTVGEIAVAAGPPGAGKTAAAHHLAMCVASGRTFLEQDTKPAGVLLVGTENRHEDERRLLAASKFHEYPRDLPLKVFPRAVRLFDEKARTAPGEDPIVQEALAMERQCGHACRLILIDNLRRVISPGSANDEAHATIVMRALERIRDATGATVLIIHHSVRDGSRFAGSGAIESHADSVWHFLPGKARGAHVIGFQKLRLGDKNQALRYRFAFDSVAVDEDGEDIRTVVVTDDRPTTVDLAVDEADAPEEPVTVVPEIEADDFEARTSRMLEAAGSFAEAFRLSDLMARFNSRRQAGSQQPKQASLSRAALQIYVDHLLERGFLVKEGASRSTVYRVPNS